MKPDQKKKRHGFYLKPPKVSQNRSFSHFCPHFTSETTNFQQLVSKKLCKIGMVSLKPHVVSREKVKNVEWFQKNCKILKLQRVYEKKVTKLSDFFVRVALYF